MVNNNSTPIDDLIKKTQSVPSGILKEFEPVILSPENYEIKEDEEHQIEGEARSYVEIKPQSIKLPPDLQKLGIQSTSSSSFGNQTYQNVKLPISDDKVLSGLHAPINSSFRWLATLAIYILSRAHLGLKKVGGHIIRVVKK